MDENARKNIAEELGDAPDYYWTNLSPFPASVRALGAMILANQHRGQSTVSQIKDLPKGTTERWTSTVSFIDRLCGGFYGLTTLGGSPGLGKSLLSRASAIEAAASTKWNVIVFDAENAPDELGAKYDEYLAEHPGAEDAVDNLRIVHVPRGIDVATMIAEVALIAGDDRPVLTVIDSINTVAELTNRSYLDALREYSLWAMLSRRISRGAASFLMVSELNRAGGAKGEKLNYWSDLFVQLTGERQKGYVRMKIKKTRSTPGESEERKLVRIVHRQRFLEESEMQQQRAHVRAVGEQDDLL